MDAPLIILTAHRVEPDHRDRHMPIADKAFDVEPDVGVPAAHA